MLNCVNVHRAEQKAKDLYAGQIVQRRSEICDRGEWKTGIVHLKCEYGDPRVRPTIVYFHNGGYDYLDDVSPTNVRVLNVKSIDIQCAA